MAKWAWSIRTPNQRQVICKVVNGLRRAVWRPRHGCVSAEGTLRAREGYAAFPRRPNRGLFFFSVLFKYNICDSHRLITVLFNLDQP